jgi:FkbM family methyltransferase
MSQKKKNEENINNNTNIEGEDFPEISYEKFDENIFQEVKKQQMEFCNNQNKYIKTQIEKQIILAKASFLNKNFNMYVYNQPDYVSNSISNGQSWEFTETKTLIDALNYYSSLKNISNDNIYILDIGANVGWYTFSLANCGYQVLSFEASVVNNYILKKNFCLNPNLNITLINKGLYNEEKKCDYYFSERNIGNGMIQCDKNANVSSEFIKSSESYLTKLSNYIDFLSTKNLALIKIDIEGSEEKAIEGGIELISNYHVPFIFLEFFPRLLIMHGTDPMKFLEIFEMNGYKFAKNNYFDSNYYTKQEIIEQSKERIITLYIVYSNIIKDNKKNTTNNPY